MFIDLVYQVQKLLRAEHGGTGNRKALSRGVVFKALNNSLATIPIGSTVKRSAYAYEVVVMTTATDDPVIGVSVGDVDVDSDEINVDASTVQGGTVAVAVSGIVDVRLGANVTAGQYAFAHATDGTAYGAATVVGSFGLFVTTGTTGNKARVLLSPDVAHEHVQYSETDHTHEGIGAVWHPVMAFDPSDSRWHVVVAGDGTAVMAEVP